MLPIISFLPVLLLPLFLFYFFPRNHLPPGPSFFSMILERLRAPHLDLSAAFLKTLRIYGPVFTTYFGPFPTIVTTNPQDITQVLSTLPRTDAITKAFKLGLPGGFFAMSPSTHRGARKKVLSRFHNDMLGPLHPRIQSAVMEFVEQVDRYRKEGVLDISRYLSDATTNVILGVSLGLDLPVETRAKFNKAVDDLLMTMAPLLVFYPVPYWFESLGVLNPVKNARKRIDALVEDFTQERMERKNEKDDLFAVLRDLHTDRSMIISSMAEIVLSGTVTTSNMLSWALYEMLKKPATLTKLRAEVDAKFGHMAWNDALSADDCRQLQYALCIVKETLRLHPGNIAVSRQANKDMILKGSRVQVPKGTTIMAYTAGMHLDASLWKNPKEFVPERWGAPTTTYLPFSMGEYGCVGKFLVEFEGPLLLAEFVRRFDFKLACSFDEVVNFSTLVENPRTQTEKGKGYDGGVPLHVTRRDRFMTKA